MEIKVIELSDSFIDEASLLLAAYRFESDWDNQKQEECKATLLCLLKLNQVFCLLAQHEGSCLGFLTFHWGFSMTKGLPILKIQDVFTLPSYRKLGIAKTLINHTIEIANNFGAHRLQLETDTDNIPARTLYSNIGFEWIAHKEVFMLPLKQWKYIHQQEERNEQ
ncbi:GNAT family N-acetyltransferase [Paenibacillus yanchengensis]|uniref:GNAT family N-acetyltransferase n=1 Tax=Paenibacillus yanchengensis TaxID=2035833 RepID=A0ABW4YHM8_9BACL